MDEGLRKPRLPTAARRTCLWPSLLCVDQCPLVLDLWGLVCSCPVACGLKPPETSPRRLLDGDAPCWRRARLWSHGCPPRSAAPCGVPRLARKRSQSFLPPPRAQRRARNVQSWGLVCWRKQTDHCGSSLGNKSVLVLGLQNQTKRSRDDMAGRPRRIVTRGDRGRPDSSSERPLHVAGHAIGSPLMGSPTGQETWILSCPRGKVVWWARPWAPEPERQGSRPTSSATSQAL